MTQRPGGFPRTNRPPSPAKPAPAAVEAKPTEATQAPQRAGFSRLPVRPTQPVPAAVEYVARPAPPPLPSAEFFADAFQDAADPDSARSIEQFPEALYDDSDDAPEITVPLQPLPRPPPTVLHPTAASRAAPPPVRQPGSGLLASNVVAPVRTRPSFLPPPRERPALPPSAPSPTVGLALTQAQALPPPQPRDMPSPAPARPMFQSPAPKVDAKPSAPALPRVSMHDAAEFQARRPTRVPERPSGPAQLTPDDIPF
jgi:hypothetical protein